ncbi:retrovirus-related Pol polyprotein from transposon 297, partial [Caerostris extrusa]
PARASSNSDREQSKSSKQPLPKFRENFNRDQHRNKLVVRGAYRNRVSDGWEKRDSLRCYECGDAGHLRSYYEESRKFTSFVVPDGQYEFNKVPFGLSTSPSVFQRYVYSIFRHLMNKGIVITYMDDLIIPSEDEVEGHIVENGTIRPSPAKTIAVKRFPVPTNVKRIQSFLGLTSYFRKFIPEYSKIAKPLSDLLRKDHPFTMGEDQIDAFEKLKNLLTRSPVLTIFKQGRTTELHTDASKYGYGAALLQAPEDGKLHPIHHMSKKRV